MRKIWKQTADFFFPMGTYCICCGKYIDHTRTYALCDHCIRHIRWGQIEINLDAEGKHWKRPAYLDSASACAFYGLYSRRLIFELKYNGHTYVARSIAEILCDRVAGDPAAQRLLRADWVVPVPIHKSRNYPKNLLTLLRLMFSPLMPVQTLNRHRKVFRMILIL